MTVITLPTAEAVSALVLSLPVADRSRLIAEASEAGYVVAIPDDLDTAVSSVDLEAAQLAVLKTAATAAVDAHVEATARSRGYNSASTCASYVASTNEKWAGEAAAFVAWRDEVWGAVLTILAAVEAGESTPPTVEELVSGLPVIQWSE